jgi:hypothetical protein
VFPIDDPTAVVTPPARQPAGTPGYFTLFNGSGTTVSADWLNIVQNEIVNVIVAANLSLDKTDDTQLLQAINQIADSVAQIDIAALMGNYVLRSGDTMSGLLTLGTQPITNPLHAVTKRYVDAEILRVMESILGIPDLPDLTNFITQGGLEAALAAHVLKAGDTMTGLLTLSGAPTANLHAATKAYVDGRTMDQLTGISTGTGFLQRTGTNTWALSTPSGGIADAPNDGGYYARRNQAWAAFTPGAGGGGTGTVTSIVAGTGLTGGTITASGTIALAVPVSLANGGTNATTAANARTQLAITMDNVTGISSGTGYLQRTGTNAWSLGTPSGGNFLPLAGGTLTGALAGTGATFSGRVTGNDLSTAGGWIMSANGNGDMVFGRTNTNRLASFNMNADTASTPVDLSIGRNVWVGNNMAVTADASANRHINNAMICYGDASANRNHTNTIFIGGIQLWNNGRLRVEGQGIHSWDHICDGAIISLGSEVHGVGVVSDVDMRCGWDFTAVRTIHSYGGNIVAAGGAIYAAGGGVWAYSEARLKQNIMAYDAGLAEILQLHPVSFEYTNASGFAQVAGTQYGLTIEDVEAVLPELVRVANTRQVRNDEDLKVYNPTSLVLPLINAVKELARRLDILEQK